jgi:hypothetical protein
MKSNDLVFMCSLNHTIDIKKRLGYVNPNLLIRNSSIVFKGSNISTVFITNLLITIVTNDVPFCNSGYRWYMSQGEQHSPKHKDQMHVRYIFPVLTYTSL